MQKSTRPANGADCDDQSVRRNCETWPGQGKFPATFQRLTGVVSRVSTHFACRRPIAAADPGARRRYAASAVKTPIELLQESVCDWTEVEQRRITGSCRMNCVTCKMRQSFSQVRTVSA